MDYEKKYKEALERAKKALEVFGTDKCEGARQIFSLFPELKESEDEQVRKDIIDYLKKNLRLEWATWLEKQGGKIQYWEPSEEQLDALDYAYNSCPDTERGNYYEGVLGTIIDDLYKLSEKQGKQKPYWSEEDESYLNTTIAYLKDAKEFKKTAENCITWLKSLKERL